MFQTLELVNAALARVQADAAVHAPRSTANRLTFAAFPIIGYSLTSDTMPQTKLWEMATYDIKPRLNRLDGVSHGGGAGRPGAGVPNQPDPAKLLQAERHRSRHSGCGPAQQHDRFAGPARAQSPAGSEPGQRPGAHAGRDRQHRGQDHAGRHAGSHRRCGHGAPFA